MPANIQEIIIKFVQADSIGSIIIRCVIWLFFVTIIAIGTAKGQSHSTIKAEAGFFVLFIVLTGIMIYLMFGVAPTISFSPNSWQLPKL